ncbi:hypothetical protein HW555_009448 [Spodoptera exigua]|uniref:trypsin n=1 Tax=Spodoptera exigua TaxID=7107 RepID=A0A835GAZ3_SPOEX|nr:hypothetical protein HW555_009448 [Spodoptera exigua]
MKKNRMLKARRGEFSKGDRCEKDGVWGICTNLNRCQSAIQEIRNRINPKICTFKNADPIVCCVDRNSGPTATTTKRPLVTTTPVYIPPVYDYVNVDPTHSGCEPIPESLTAKKTGQKAFDKCIEYQEQLVYPCEKGVALTGDLSRSNRCHHNADELIIGGTDAAQYEFPHMVMVGYGELKDVQWLCGGALISDKFILTAGHCIASRDLGPITYVVVGALRRSDAADRSKIYKVKNIIKHPQFQPPAKYNDIALIETENTIKLDQFVVPACLHVGDNINDEKVQATGWGLTQYSGSVSDTLQKVVLNKFTTAECSAKYQPVRLMKQGFDAQSQLCYGDKLVSKDTCQGDSGGPIQVKSKNITCMYTVVGVTSFGRACGFVGEPGIYTRVANYVPWIESIVWPN